MRAFYLSIVFACLVTAPAMLAQEGHPLVGSWHGDWGSDPNNRTDLTVVIDWDGAAITGIVNPGFDQAHLQNARLDPSDWSVRFEVELKDRSGNSMRCTANGRIDRLGSDRRTLAGTWNCGALQADFQLTRARDY